MYEYLLGFEIFIFLLCHLFSWLQMSLVVISQRVAWSLKFYEFFHPTSEKDRGKLIIEKEKILQKISESWKELANILDLVYVECLGSYPKG